MTISDLKTQLFARRRYHEAGNRQGDTVEQWRKRERLMTLAIWIGAIVFMPIFIALWSYMDRHYGPREPLPLWLILLWFSVMVIALSSCMYVPVFQFLRPRPCYGRWIIAFGGIFYRYGKSPHRFVPLASLRNLRVEKLKSGFAVIVFDTDQKPLRIAEQADGDRNRTVFLPFLNDLIDRLKQMGWSNPDLTPLLKLQRVIQGRYVDRQYFLYTLYLMMACYIAPIFCVLPFYSLITATPYPAVWCVMAFCVLVVCLIGYALNSRLECWKNKKIDEKLHSLAQENTH